jgi:hypothetical protein
LKYIETVAGIRHSQVFEIHIVYSTSFFLLEWTIVIYCCFVQACLHEDIEACPDFTALGMKHYTCDT